jgi:hypothetical protein
MCPHKTFLRRLKALVLYLVAYMPVELTGGLAGCVKVINHAI